MVVAALVVVAPQAMAQSVKAEGFATFDKRYGDPFISSDGRMFLSMSPLGSCTVKLYKRLANGSMVEYPSKEVNDDPGAVIAARVSTGVRH